MFGKEKEPRCHLSHPAHPHTLSPVHGQSFKSGCFVCGIRSEFWDSLHYYCTSCDLEFHDRCQDFPRKITHPFHLHHPLFYTDRNTEASYSGSSGSINNLPSQSDILVFDKCNWCGNDLGDRFYRCYICNFCLDYSCMRKDPPLVISNPKSHHHSLFFFPRPLLVPCDACGWVDESEPSYSCFQCNYIVHQACIDLPRVIKITRHPHRLSYSPSLPPAISTCKVCYKRIDIKHGQYSCNHEDCSYAVHSKCATHEDIWEGVELEWEPEEPDESEAVSPFQIVGIDLIKHFSHDHHLRHEMFDSLRDSEKQCQACVFPIDHRNFYSCVECDFFLHEVCAGLPKMLNHALHKSPLTLIVSSQDDMEFGHAHYGFYPIDCSACYRWSTGFRYKCKENCCVLQSPFQVDVRCIFVPECFTHKSHEHPLFISILNSYTDETYCWGCRKQCYGVRLHCTTLCDFALCYECVTLPNELQSKYDEHLLSLRYGEDANGAYWCDVCEKKLDSTEWFYTCDKCCTTIHRQCIFGSSVYMISGSTFLREHDNVQVFRNNSITRPVCSKCHDRCPGYIYYKTGWSFDAEWSRKVNCSLRCLGET